MLNKEAFLGLLSGGDIPRYAQAAGRCLNPPIGCGQPITGFTDALSEKEYRLTGLCQKCQDDFAAASEDETA